jgi:hypothetical protein
MARDVSVLGIGVDKGMVDKAREPASADYPGDAHDDPEYGSAFLLLSGSGG